LSSEQKESPKTPTPQKGSFPYILVSLFLLFSILGAIGGYYYFSTINETKEIPKQNIVKSEKVENKNVELISRLENMIEENQKSIVTELSKTKEINASKYRELDALTTIPKIPPPPMISKENPDLNKTENIDLEYHVLDHVMEDAFTPKTVERIDVDKPKLAIIIDDIGMSAQLKALLSLNLKITPSIFPSNKFHPGSANLAQKTHGNFMIHLPLEAMSHTKPEEYTIKVTDSEAEIEEKVKRVRMMFPDAKYTNNHTGSKFTADEKSMRKLLTILERYGLTFLDSKTSSHSKALMIDENILFRDVFLDNNRDEAYILGQLKKAIEKAKKRGYAIAIGHPYSATFITLKKHKNLFKDVELVTISELYKIIRDSKG